MGTVEKSRDEERTGPAKNGKQPGLNGDSQRAASLSTGTGNGQEVQVRVPEGVTTGEVKSLNMNWIEGQLCSEEAIT